MQNTKSTSELKKEAKRLEAETKKLEKAYYKAKANDVLKDVLTDVFKDVPPKVLNEVHLVNEELCKIIGTMPRNEAAAALKEVMKSADFRDMFEKAYLARKQTRQQKTHTQHKYPLS